MFLADAVIRARPRCVPAFVTGTVTDVLPCGTVTVAGTEAMAVLPLVTATTALTGAGGVRYQGATLGIRGHRT